LTHWGRIFLYAFPSNARTSITNFCLSARSRIKSMHNIIWVLTIEPLTRKCANLDHLHCYAYFCSLQYLYQLTSRELIFYHALLRANPNLQTVGFLPWKNCIRTTRGNNLDHFHCYASFCLLQYLYQLTSRESIFYHPNLQTWRVGFLPWINCTRTTRGNNIGTYIYIPIECSAMTPPTAH